MRELPAILLTVFLMTSVCLGASEVLTNDTGRTATGVVVTFSGKVTLASWDDSVFPDVRPTGQAKSFAFSGGSLPSNRSFQISWSPSSATIVDIEWKRGAAVGLDAAGIDWNSLPVSISYDYSVAPSWFSCDGVTDMAAARFWGRDGTHVKAVRAALSEAGLAVDVELYDGDKWGNYGYIVTFEVGTFKLHVFLYPQDVKQTRLAANEDGKWTELGAVSGTSYRVADLVMSAWFPSALYSERFTAETLTASPVDLHLDYIQGSRRELFGYSGRGNATWIGREPAIAEIPGLESVGNPFRRRYPGEGALAFPRTVWDMQAWNGRIYFGHGDYGGNAGPIDVWYYAPDQARFVAEFSVDDEQIGRYCPIGDRLFIPGYDAMESWSFGNLYVNEGTGWQKLRTIPNAVHVYDLAMYEGRLYAVGSGGLPGDPPPDMGGFVGVSDDVGRSWGIEQHFGPFSEEGITRVRSPSDPGVWRFMSLFELQGKLFASGWGASRIYELGPGGFSVLRVDPFPGTASQFDEAPLLPPNEIDLSMKELYHLYADPKVGGYIARSVQFSGQLVYIGQGIGLFEATAMQDGQIRRVLDLGAAWQPRDLIATGDQLYALCVSAMDSGFQSRVYVTRDLNEWSVVTDFAADAPAFSIEVLDGYLYLGLGGAYLSSGNIYRVKLSGE
jgi:hypothetical protein